MKKPDTYMKSAIKLLTNVRYEASSLKANANPLTLLIKLFRGRLTPVILKPTADHFWRNPRMVRELLFLWIISK